MKISMAILAVVMLAVLGLAGCGGDGNNGGSSSNSGCSAAKEKTPAEKRQAVVDKMKTAFESLDADALKPLFLEDEQELAENRIGKEWREMKTEGFTVAAKSAKVEEKDGKFYAVFKLEIEQGGQTETDDPSLGMVEKDGKWYLSFKK
ncbi:MAG: hypothetical protein KDB32_06130 [Planctomycetes bacterium]|nr:hypothetical protein [Planctomycetota bacterium]